MPDHERIEAIFGDHRSGAGEIGSHLAAELSQAGREEPARLEATLARATELALARFPMMANLLRLLDDAWQAFENGESAGAPVRVAAELARHRRAADPTAIAERLVRVWGHPRTVLTLSRSGTVLSVLRALHQVGREFEVLVGEGRPEGEGVSLARDLAADGIRATVVVDAALPALAAGGPAPPPLRATPRERVVLLGADAITGTFFINKVGSYPLALAAHGAGMGVWLAAGEDKLLPPGRDEALLLPWDARPWPGIEAPAAALRFDFERVPLALVAGVVLPTGVAGASELAAKIGGLSWSRHLAAALAARG